MTTAIFFPPSITESFEIVLGRACDLQDKGENVLAVYCTGEIRGCVGNPYGLTALCKHCTQVTENAIEILLPNSQKEVYSRVISSFQKSELDLKAVEDGPRSTILTFYRQDIRNPNWTHKNAFFLPGLFKRFKKYEKSVYLFAMELIKKIKPQRIEYFNGRITPTMSIMQAAIDCNVDYVGIEVSGYKKGLFLAKNTKVHDLNFLKKRLANYKLTREAREMASKFFANKRIGVNTNDKVYTKNQREGLFDKLHKKNIAVFLSSTDEFEIFGDEWFTTCSRDPAEFILSLRNLLDKSHTIVVRMHPNQAGDKTGMSEYIQKKLTGHSGIKLIRPKDKHSSYELMEIACAVITFGSTIGIEATYWGKPSILVGRCAWEGEDVAYVLGSAEETAKIITLKPSPKKKEGAIKVAAYYMDTLDETLNLSYEHNSGLFMVKGMNFLEDKRKSIAYKINRAIDKFLIR